MKQINKFVDIPTYDYCILVDSQILGVAFKGGRFLILPIFFYFLSSKKATWKKIKCS